MKSIQLQGQKAIDLPGNSSGALTVKKLCFLLRTHFMVSTGGAELQAYYLADSFAKKGWDVHYILEEKNFFSKTDNINGISLHWIKQREAGSGLLNYFQLSKILRTIAPDVIYQRGALDYTGILGFLASKHNMKYVWAAASNKDCQKRKYTNSLLHNSKATKKLLRYPKLMANDCLVSYGIKHAHIAVVQSMDQQRLLEEHFGKYSQVVRSGHPVPDPSAAKAAFPTVLWTANLKAWKRVDRFIELAKVCQDLPAKFKIIGRGRPETIQHILAAATALPNLQYLGALDVREVESYMSEAAIFVNTSSPDHEGFPNTFIQAWMRKTPVVSLNTDPDELIKKHELGFHTGNFDQMVRDVRLLITDSYLRQHMGENAYHYATKEHTIHNTVDSLERLIMTLT
jgi:glycosyltransferase involved in cell wall biosynthesis